MIDAEESTERLRRQKEWRKFRKDYMFTQRRLADLLGCSRRAVQDIEAARTTARANTQRSFAALKAKYEIEAA
jgi:DNA-binding XRE family transcriptional regulator